MSLWKSQTDDLILTGEVAEKIVLAAPGVLCGTTAQRPVPQDTRVRQETIYNLPMCCKANGNW